MNKDSIRNSLKVALGAMLALQAFGTSAQTSGGHISETYVLNWNATLYYQDSSGRFQTRTWTSQDIVAKFLSDRGIPYSSGYTLVYRPDKRDTVVIKISDPAPYTFTPADFLQFQDTFTDFPNFNNTWTLKQACINDEYHNGQVLGSLVGWEYSVKNSSGYRSSYSFSGTFQYATSDATVNGPAGVYSGYFSTGSKIWSHDY
jgi:hypothetical protein